MNRTARVFDPLAEKLKQIERPSGEAAAPTADRWPRHRAKARAARRVKVNAEGSK